MISRSSLLALASALSFGISFRPSLAWSAEPSVWTMKGPDPRGWIGSAESEVLELGTPQPGGSHQGHLTYAIPIELPTGFAPELSLNYRSVTTEGLAGVGWDLTGFPAVVRLPDEDGLYRVATARYAFSPGGPNVKPAGEYVLVSDDLMPGWFRLIRDDGSRFEPSPSLCSGTPCFWRRHDGGGGYLQFGGFASHFPDGAPSTSYQTAVARDARPYSDHPTGIVHAWGLAEGVDAFGNSYRIQYRPSGSPLVPSFLTFPHHPLDTSTDLRTVSFHYASNPGVTGPERPPGGETTSDVSRAHAIAGPLRWQDQLDEITVGTAREPLLRKVELVHGVSSASGRRLLERIRRPGHPDIVLHYGGASAAPTLATSGGRALDIAVGTTRDDREPRDPDVPLSGRLRLQSGMGDINGDGYPDLVRAFRGGTSELNFQRSDWAYTEYVEVALGGPQGLGALVARVSRALPDVNSDREAGAAFTMDLLDLDDDGRMDLLLTRGEANRDEVEGDGFIRVIAYSGADLAGSAADPSPAVDGRIQLFSTPILGARKGGGSELGVETADVDRDGRPDIVIYHPLDTFIGVLYGETTLAQTLQPATLATGPGQLPRFAVLGQGGQDINASPCQNESFLCPPTDTTFFRGAALTDINGDEYPDFTMVYASQGGLNANAYSQNECINNGGTDCSPQDGEVRIVYAFGGPRAEGGLGGVHNRARTEYESIPEAAGHRLVTGDFDGDGIGDLALLWLRQGDPQRIEANDPGQAQYFPPFFRQSLFIRGRRFDREDIGTRAAFLNNSDDPSMSGLLQRGDFRTAILPVARLRLDPQPTGGVTIDYDQSRLGGQEALVSDLDGDGRSDLVFAARAAFGVASPWGNNIPYGEVVDVAFGRPVAHQNAGVEPPVEDIVRMDPQAPSNQKWPLAEIHIGTWRHAVGDINGDGLPDLIRWLYARPGYCHPLGVCPTTNNQNATMGLTVEIARGTPRGLTNWSRAWFRDPNAFPSRGGVPDPQPYRLVQAFPELHVADVNGDGIDDLVFVDDSLAERVFSNVVLGPTPVRTLLSTPNPEPADRLVQVDNGYGGRYEARYRASGRAGPAWTRSNDGPHVQTTGTCASGACGRPLRRPESLLETLTEHDGRGGFEVERMAYRDRRFREGRSLQWRDLGFAERVVADGRAGARAVWTFRQDQPFHGLPEEVVATDGDDETHLVSRFEFSQNPRGRVLQTREDQWMCLGSSSSSSCVAGAVHRRWTSWSHDPLGRPVETQRCVDEQCSRSTQVWDLDLSRFITSFVRQQVVYEAQDVGAPALDRVRVLDARRTTPLFGDLTRPMRTERILFALADDGQCDEDPTDLTSLCASAVSAGRARWVTQWSVQPLVGPGYDDHGNLVLVFDPLGRPSAAEYDLESWTGIRTTHNALGHRREVFRDTFGRPTHQVDANNQLVQVAYDEAGRLESETVYALAAGRPVRTSKWERLGTVAGSASQRVTETRVFTATDEATTAKYFDGVGFVYRVEDTGRGVFNDWERGYTRVAGAERRVRRFSEPYACATWGSCDTSRSWFEVVHDARGRPLEVSKTPNGYATTTLGRYRYESALVQGRVASCVSYQDSAGSWTQVCYDGTGAPVRLVDAEGETTTYNYDGAGRLTSVDLPGAGHSVSYVYDGWGRVVSQSHWQTGQTEYTWTDTNQLERQVDADGRTVEYRYDDLDRRGSEWHADGPGQPLLQVNTWRYDGSDPFEIGRLSEVDFPSGQRSFDYDGLGRLRAEQLELNSFLGGGPRAFDFGFELDWQGRTTRQTHPNGSEVVTRFVAGEGLVEAIELDGSTLVDYTAFDPSGRVTDLIYGNGTASRFGYDPEKQSLNLRQVTRQSGTLGSVLVEESYEHDWAGNLTSITDLRSQTLLGGIETNTTQTFGYDRRHRLRSVTGNVFGPGGQEDFRTDGAGELVEKAGLTFRWTACGGLGPTRCLLAEEEVGGSPVLRWESRHSLAGYRTRSIGDTDDWSYAYDASGRLTSAALTRGATSVGGIQYAYDESRNRLEKSLDVATGPPVVAIYPGHGYEVRVDPSDPSVEAVSITVSGPSGLIATQTFGQGLSAQPDAQSLGPSMSALVADSLSGPGLGLTYHHPDHLGSPTLVTNEAGLAVARYFYAPYGELRRAHSVGTDVATRKFTGHEDDAATGLLYMKARSYDPYSGRFLSPDLVTPGGGLISEGFNRYTYVLGNPLKFIDPDGKRPDLASRAFASESARGHFAGSDAAHRERLTEIGLEAVRSDHDDIMVMGTVAALPAPPPVTAVVAYLASRANRVRKAVVRLQRAMRMTKRVTAKADDVPQRRPANASLDASTICGTNGSCTDPCFVAGTLVAVVEGQIPIEDIVVGDRVLTESGESTAPLSHSDHRVVSLRLLDGKNAHHEFDIEILRSTEWMASHGLNEPGDAAHFFLPELNVGGWAVVERVGPPLIEEGQGRVVTMTLNHFNNDVYELSFAEGGEPLRGTGLHPLYSLDRDDWVRVRDLQVGERLQTAEGAVTVEALEKVRGLHRVYNLEVEGDHEYLVGEAAVRAHNSEALNCGGAGRAAADTAQYVAPRVRAFDRAGIKTTDHFRNRVAGRGARGITGENALDAYNNGRLFYNPATKNYVRHSSRTGVSVIVDKPRGGTAITVFEGKPSDVWLPVRKGAGG